MYILLIFSFLYDINLIELYDSKFEEYEELELPLYRKNDKRYMSFLYMGTTYIVKDVPTLKMVQKAYEYQKWITQES
ncbi:MAG: hypothetical protein Q4D02_00580 [Clostridia bacterium]|nr:hypothetical protein [Clostridia bacterium]